MKLTRMNVFWLLGAVLLIGLSACKMDMEQEIWLKKNESGNAKITIHLNIPISLQEEDMGDLDLNKNNALSDLAEKAKTIKGVSVTRLDTETNHTDEDMNYIYTMEFTFKDITGLRETLCLCPDQGITLQKVKGGKALRLDSRQFAITQEGDEESMEYLSFIGMELKTIVHLPKKPKSIDETGTLDKKAKTATWNETIDKDWYELSEKPMQVTF